VVPVLVAGHCKLNNVKKPDEKIKRQENMHLSNENPIILFLPIGRNEEESFSMHSLI
jgi:hypothetical protein